MENKINTVTIDLEDYDLIKKAEFMFGDLIEELLVIIDNTSLDYSGNDLLIYNDNLKHILKKYCAINYQRRLSILKKAKEEGTNE